MRAPMAAVWLVGGPVHDDRSNLRYSLRSLAENVPWLSEPWVVGDCPGWLSDDVRKLPLEPRPKKMDNQRASLTATVNHPDMADTVLVCNDDHYFMRPARKGKLPVIHAGMVADYTGKLLAEGFNPNNTWLKAVIATGEWVQQQGYEPRCYETHTPLLFDRAKLAATLDAYPQDRPLAYPQLYPLAGAGPVGDEGQNCKIITEAEYDERVPLGLPYLSSTDASWLSGRIGKLIREQFTTPCKWEGS